MITNSLLHTIAKKEKFEVSNIQQLYGGDINEVFRISTSNGEKVIKLNSNTHLPNLFKREKEGLEALSSTHTFIIPQIESLGDLKNGSYLVMNYIPLEAVTQDHWEFFSKNLALLHQQTQEYFGFSNDNYIGSLPQINTPIYKNAIDFYRELRLMPQLQLAQQSGFTFENADRFLKNLENIIPKEAPALIHGDLWSGNFIATTQNQIALIDPATHFGIREIDLAMMQLFGGFPDVVFKSYEEHFPLEKNWSERQPIFQLYFLLVHLNIFGSSYFPRCQEIISRFS